MIAANEYNNQTNKQTHTHTKTKTTKKTKKTKTKKKQKKIKIQRNQVEPGGSISWCVHLGMIFINIS